MDTTSGHRHQVDAAVVLGAERVVEHLSAFLNALAPTTCSLGLLVRLPHIIPGFLDGHPDGFLLRHFLDFGFYRVEFIVGILCVGVDFWLRFHLTDSLDFVACLLGFLSSRVIHPGFNRNAVGNFQDFPGHLLGFLARPSKALSCCNQLIIGTLELVLDFLLRTTVLNHRVSGGDAVPGDAVQHLLVRASLLGRDIEGRAILLDGLIYRVN